jgi:hypothetical protein
MEYLENLYLSGANCMAQTVCAYLCHGRSKLKTKPLFIIISFTKYDHIPEFIILSKSALKFVHREFSSEMHDTETTNNTVV